MGCDDISWLRLGAGHYVTTDGRWSLRSWRAKEWWTFRHGAPWGRWRRKGDWWVYVPFRTKWEAELTIEENASLLIQSPGNGRKAVLSHLQDRSSRP